MIRICFLLFSLHLGVTKGLSQTKNFIDQPFIETSATVDTLITPDRIYLNILLSEKDTKGNSSVEALESSMEKTLKSIGIDTEKNLTLNDLASNFKKYFLKQRDVLKTKAYSLMVQDAYTAGKVIVALEGISISNVYLDRVEYSKIEQLKLELKSKAVRKARLQAAFMAAPISTNVGMAIFISDQTKDDVESNLEGRVSGIRLRGYTAKGISDYNPADIEFDKIKVQSIVHIKFKLE